MIELTQFDEYGEPYSTETFLTVEDARDALNQMELALDDATGRHVYTLQELIDQLKEAIAEHEP